MSKSKETHLLLHPDHARPLLNKKPIALLSEIWLEVGLQRIGICTRWMSYRTYKLRILLELLERLGEASVMEIVEDRLVSIQV